jgi:hypothetical protein
MLYESIPLDGPSCSTCGTVTSLARRTPIPAMGRDAELRVYDCPCGETICWTVARDGAKPVDCARS